jgi:hypothetical protein
VLGNAAAASGRLRIDLPHGWSAQPAWWAFELRNAGDQQEFAFEITPPAKETTGQMRAVAEIGGRAMNRGMEVISYPHIPVQAVFPPAEKKLVRADIKITTKNVGYIMGVGDEMADAIRQLGASVSLLTAADLEQGDFSPFDAIVTGVRAYSVRSGLRTNQHRLLDYVYNGGTLIVQYNGIYGPPLPRLGPYPITISHNRVSVADAPVTLPNPEHPLLHKPNEITPRDFETWVQERGLYFASDWDPRYQPVLESRDPNEPRQTGGMLYTRYGKGVYIFSAYSWFRQLPAGIPGACRIFANMLSAK